MNLEDTQEFEVIEGDPKARRLRALSGGNPYVFIVAGAGGTDVDMGGISPDDLPLVLQELIDLLVED